MREIKICPQAGRCGGCTWQGTGYPEQLAKKQKAAQDLLGEFCTVHPITGMENPYHYRSKAHAVFSRTRTGRIVSGMYEEHSHRVVPVEDCQIENEAAAPILATIRSLLPSFKIPVYDEDTGFGFLRHVLIRVGTATKQVMVVLVTASPVFPSKNNFVSALRKRHPEITTIIQNINNHHTSMVLGTRDIVLYGKGYITDRLGGLTFRISPQSFYQVNPLQTEKLYAKAMELAHLTGSERVLDAYCGTGTIGLLASLSCGEVLGVELNREAVSDAVRNAKENGIANARFVCDDAGSFMSKMVETYKEQQPVNVLFIDPPRAGCTETFLSAACELAPPVIVYISCNPETQRRDILSLSEKGYRAEEVWPFDLFPFTDHLETICKLSKRNGK